MVGQRFLEPLIEVRILVGQHDYWYYLCMKYFLKLFKKNTASISMQQKKEAAFKQVGQRYGRAITHLSNT
jgi:hypothetical protein